MVCRVLSRGRAGRGRSTAETHLGDLQQLAFDVKEGWDIQGMPSCPLICRPVWGSSRVSNSRGCQLVGWGDIIAKKRANERRSTARTPCPSCSSAVAWIPQSSYATHHHLGAAWDACVRVASRVLGLCEKAACLLNISETN